MKIVGRPYGDGNLLIHRFRQLNSVFLISAVGGSSAGGFRVKLFTFCCRFIPGDKSHCDSVQEPRSCAFNDAARLSR